MVNNLIQSYRRWAIGGRLMYAIWVPIRTSALYVSLTLKVDYPWCLVLDQVHDIGACDNGSAGVVTGRCQRVLVNVGVVETRVSVAADLVI